MDPTRVCFDGISTPWQVHTVLGRGSHSAGRAAPPAGSNARLGPFSRPREHGGSRGGRSHRRGKARPSPPAQRTTRNLRLPHPMLRPVDKAYLARRLTPYLFNSPSAFVVMGKRFPSFYQIGRAHV